MKKIFTAFLIFIIVFSLIGCTSSEAADSSSTELQEQTPEGKMSNRHFIDVVETSDYYRDTKLVYDSETNIIYYYQYYHFNNSAASSLCPYYSANGYLCRYNTETNQIEEIIH